VGFKLGLPLLASSQFYWIIMFKFLRIYHFSDNLWEVVDERSDSEVFQGTLEECEKFIAEVCSP